MPDTTTKRRRGAGAPPPPGSRAVSVVRVSKLKYKKVADKKHDERIVSPAVQRERVREEADTHEWLLNDADVLEEMNVSGGADLANRPTLEAQIRRIEDGDARVLLAPYFDRFFRNNEVMWAVVRRVEAAGGIVYAVGVGRVSKKTSGMFLRSGMEGLIAEYGRLLTSEKSGDALQDRIDRGILPWPNLVPGFILNEDRTYRQDPERAPVVLEAFEMRAAGKTVKAIRDFMRANGFPDITHRTVERLLADRSGAVRGAIHFGSFEPNERAHDAIVTPELWRAVQNTKVPRGRLAKSERLLARTGVLRCGTCDRSMVIGRSNYRYFAYRCTWMDCPKRMTIAAPMIEEIAANAAVARAMDTTGRATAEDSGRVVRDALVRAQATLDAAIKGYAAAGVATEPSAVEEMTALRHVRDEAQDRVDELPVTPSTVTIEIASDWLALSLAEQRELIKSTIKRIVIAPGRGLERITVELYGARAVITEDLTVSVLGQVPADVERAAQRVADRAARRLT